MTKEPRSDLYARAKSIFVEAIERDSEALASFLSEACDGDAELRREVDALLMHHDARGQDATTLSQHSLAHGRLGNYRLLQRIGEGGMGEVWEARQDTPVRRRAALKIIKRGMDTRAVLARFESERQALALMNHPNIASVFEAGESEQGRPYFAMEFIPGEPITDYCDRHRLNTRERLDLFVPICAGVQHAHQKGIIHRDLKPSNILVTVEDGRPVPKIIDFGVAKATAQPLTERTLLTELGDWIGTPEYMSPEQAERTGLDIDTRTDVYSLGVLLYELLVGDRPFQAGELRAAGLDEVRRRIREEEATRPSTKLADGAEDSERAASRRSTDPRTLARELRGDLDWITMKALEKERTRRYESPSDLAADIKRHLGNEPITAGAPSRLYRASKFVRRHRLGVAAALAVLVVLLAGIAGTSVGLFRARQEADSARRLAELLTGMFEDLNPGATEGGFSTPDRILDRGVEKIDQQLASQPLVQARLMNSMGGVYTRLGRFDRALPLLERALAARRNQIGSSHPDVAASLSQLGWYRVVTGDFETGQELYEEALSIRQAALGEESVATGWSLRDLGWVHWKKGDFFTADEFYRRALEIHESALGPDDLEVAHTLNSQALLYLAWGDIEPARSSARRAAEIREDELGSDHTATGWSWSVLGLVQRTVGDYEGALSLFERNLEIQTAAFGPDHPAGATAMTNVSDALIALGRLEEARPLLERTLELRKRAFGPVHEEVMWSLRGLGWLAERAGDYPRADRYYERTLEVSEQVYPPGHPWIGWNLLSSSNLLRLQGKYDVARERAERGLAILEPILKQDSPQLASALISAGAVLRDLGDLEGAGPLLERGIGIRKRILPADSPFRADDLHTQARLRQEEGSYEEAAELYQGSIKLAGELLGPRHYFVVRGLKDWAGMLRALGQRDRAAELEARAAALEQPPG